MAKKTVNTIVDEKNDVNKSAKEKNLNAALAMIEKNFGKGAIMRMDGSQKEAVEIIPTGSISLDKALGVGGLPRGRIVEIYGPESSGKTTMCLEAIAQCQKNGGVCAFIDAENAFDPIYAAQLGVKVDELIISQPDTGEQALEILDMLVRSGGIDMAVIDSVAALVPRAEIEGEMGDSHVGLQARLMSQALRKVTGHIKQTNTLVIFINQIRMKIGVMFGCNEANNTLTLKDGSVHTIADIVNNQITGEVLSYNETTKQFEYHEIIDWQINGQVEKQSDFLAVISKSTSSEKTTFKALTPVHKNYMNDDTQKETSELKVGDYLKSVTPSFLTSDVIKIMQGLLAAHILFKNDGNDTQIKFKQSENDDNYALNSLLAEKLTALKFRKTKNNHFISNWYSSDELKVIENFNGKYEKIFHDKKIEPLTMAIWFMKRATLIEFDGNKVYQLKLSIYEKNNIKKLFEENGFGFIENKADKSHVIFDKESSLKINDLIMNFIPSSINNILINENGNGDVFWTNFKSDVILVSSVSRVEKLSKFKPKHSDNIDLNKYDITVKGNHNYVVGNVYLNGGDLIHNSPETTTGGNALKFYSSVRLDIRRTGSIKKGEDIVGNETRVKVVKNKVAPPFREANFVIKFGQGVDRALEILNLSVASGEIEKAGSWYSYNGNKIGQGQDNASNWLNENPEIIDTLYNKLMDSIKNENSGFISEDNENYDEETDSITE